MALIELAEKQTDGDLVREMLAFAAERIMKAEIEALTGAAKGAPMREVQRNGYRDRDWDTRAGRTRPSFTIRRCSSTMQIAVFRSDTSSPA